MLRKKTDEYLIHQCEIKITFSYFDLRALAMVDVHDSNKRDFTLHAHLRYMKLWTKLSSYFNLLILKTNLDRGFYHQPLLLYLHFFSVQPWNYQVRLKADDGTYYNWVSYQLAAKKKRATPTCERVVQTHKVKRVSGWRKNCQRKTQRWCQVPPRLNLEDRRHLEDRRSRCLRIRIDCWPSSAGCSASVHVVERVQERLCQKETIRKKSDFWKKP